METPSSVVRKLMMEEEQPSFFKKMLTTKDPDYVRIPKLDAVAILTARMEELRGELYTAEEAVKDAETSDDVDGLYGLYFRFGEKLPDWLQKYDTR